MKIKQLTALICAFSLALPVWATGKDSEEKRCFFWNKKSKEEQGEETVLSEEIPPRRGNGVDSFDDTNPKHEEGFFREPIPRPHPKPSEKREASCVTTGNTASYSWYCIHQKNGQIPPIPTEMSFIEDHGGYYVDRKAKEDDKVIYLTFDAGYENGNVEKILDILKEENVPGAFFILDNLVTTNTELVKRMVEEGHLVCNHTAKHRDMSKVTSKEEFAAELQKMESVFKEYTGYDMAKLYRPPEGKFSETNMIHAEELGYKTIFWSFAYADWDNNKQMSADKAADKVLSGTHNGEVLLLHPTSATNAAILSRLIKTWKSMGYRFGTLNELVGEK